MAKNLCYQMTSSIENALSLGCDKHSEKRTEQNGYKIYSYSSRKEMLDFSHDFSNFIKTNFPEVRQVRQITTEHINNYLSSKSNLTQTSIQQYVSRINKLELCCNKKFNLNLDWKTGRTIPIQGKEKIRNVVFSERQITGLEKYLSTKRDCYSKDAYYLGKEFSLRASEVVKIRVTDIHIDTPGKTDFIHIHESKGKRSRDLTITPEFKPFLAKLTEGKSPNDRVIPLRADSICAYLNRACKKLGYTNITAAKTSYHCLRKYSITQYYKQLLPIYGKKRAEEICCEYLGHGKDRKDVIERYIKL